MEDRETARIAKQWRIFAKQWSMVGKQWRMVGKQWRMVGKQCKARGDRKAMVVFDCPIVRRMVAKQWGDREARLRSKKG